MSDLSASLSDDLQYPETGRWNDEALGSFAPNESHYQRQLAPPISGHCISTIDMPILLDSDYSLQLRNESASRRTFIHWEHRH